MRMGLKFSSAFAVIACCLVLAGCSGGGGGSSEGPKVVPKGFANISGVVTGSGPVEGATVSTGRGDNIDTTNADGEYSLTVLPGKYTLILNVSGRQTTTVQDVTVDANESVILDLVAGDALAADEKAYVGSLRVVTM